MAAFVAIHARGTAQPDQLRFHHLDNTHGLPQNSVNAILEDRHGFLWFGTQDGLCRYDGHAFTTYRNDGTANSPGNNYVWSMMEAADGALWIGTFGGGLDRFDPGTGLFTHFRHSPKDAASLSGDRVLGLIEHPEGVIWVRTSKGLDRMDAATGAVTRYLKDGVTEGDLIGAIAVDDADHLLVHGTAGLLLFTMSTGHIEVVRSGNGAGNGQGVTALSRGAQGIHVLENRKLLRIDPRTGKEELLIEADAITDADAGIGFQCLLVKGDHLFIGSTHGLIHSSGRTGHTRVLRHHADDPGSIADDHVLSLYAGSGGEIWVGTRNGLDRIDRLDPPVHALVHVADEPQSLIHESVTALMEDERGRIWIGSPGGITVRDPDRGSIQHVRHDPHDPGSLSAAYVLSLAMDATGRVLVGTLGGGVQEAVETNGVIRFKRYAVRDLDDQRRANIVHHILPARHGSIWLATGGAGLCRADGDGTVSCTGPTGNSDGPAHPYLLSLLEDDHGHLWMGTAGGGVLIRAPDGRFGGLRHIPEDMGSINADLVLCTYQDPQGHLWAGTVNGVCRTRSPLSDTLRKSILEGHAGEGLFQRFNRADGLPNEVIYGIQPDGRGHLWFATNAGLVEWDPRSNKVLRILDRGDGLPGDEFNQNAFLRTRDGTLYFGGAKGLCWFKPEALYTNQRPPPVRFTGVALFNEPVPLRDVAPTAGSALERAAHELEKIDLAWHHRVVTFSFAALNYIAPEKNRYRFQLQGFDERWTELGARNEVTFTNLAPGDYALHVHAANNDGVWNEVGATMHIHVSAPPWMRWYAYLAYAMLIGGVLYAFFRYRVRQVRREAETSAWIEQARNKDREHFRRRSAADFHDEAGARITRINLYTGLVRQRATNDPQMTEHLHKIEKASRELSAGIRDLIWTMDPERDTLADTLERLATFGQALFDATTTAFKVIGPPSGNGHLRLGMEARRSITLILKEAMNNCAKYAGAHRCTLQAVVSEEWLELTLQDDGVGFDIHAPRSADHHGLRNMQQRATGSGARLDIQSAEGKGTRITLKMPLTEDRSAPLELDRP